VPRWERPFWVMEQLEFALCEGLGERVRWAATGRIIDGWHLGSGVERNRRHPDSFWIPSDEEKELLEPGVCVKLMFEMKDRSGERMWVRVEKVGKKQLVGRLDNEPIGIPRLGAGDHIKSRGTMSLTSTGPSSTGHEGSSSRTRPAGRNLPENRKGRFDPAPGRPPGSVSAGRASASPPPAASVVARWRPLLTVSGHPLGHAEVRGDQDVTPVFSCFDLRASVAAAPDLTLLASSVPRVVGSQIGSR
jgi:hypothetical protein